MTKFKRTPKKRTFLINEDVPKIEDNLQKEDNPKKEANPKKEDD